MRIAERDPALNAFSLVLADAGPGRGAGRDAALAAGEAAGPLHGVPVAIKEEIDVARVRDHLRRSRQRRPRSPRTASWYDGSGRPGR